MNSISSKAVHRILGTVLAMAFCPLGSAQMMNNDLIAEWRYPDFDAVLESHVVTVSDLVELPAADILNSPHMDIDIGDGWVEFRFIDTSNWLDTEFNGWYFADANRTIPDIIGYSIDSFSDGVTGTENIVTGFDANSFWADFGLLTVSYGGEWIRMKVEMASACLDLSVTTLVAGQAATWDIGAATPNAQVAVVYGFNPGHTVLENYWTNWCADFGIEGVNGRRVICLTFANRNGTASCRAFVPKGTTGIRILSQATERNNCPDPCMSNSDDQIVQ